MQKAFSKLVWKNLPSTETALEADNLNRIENGVDLIDDRVVEMDTTKANETDILLAIKVITFDEATGIFTFTRFNGTSFTLDTKLEKIAVNFDYDPATQQLILTLIDGTKVYIDLSALITQYEFIDSATIHFTTDQNGRVIASIINGSITEDKLQPNFLADCRHEVDLAQSYSQAAAGSASDSEESAKTSEAWATGNKDGVPVPNIEPQHNNNAEYYAGQAALQAQDAEQAKTDAQGVLTQVMEAANQVQFMIDFVTGELMYSTDNPYEFRINTTTGNLEWRVKDNV